MTIERKLIPCEEDDPRRCQAQGDVNEGQCKFTATEGQPYCPKHGGTKMAEKVEKKKVHDYRLQVWQERLNEFTESDNVKNLRGEIGVLRLIIEEIMNRCHTNEDLILYSGRISDLVSKVEKLVVSCQRFETSMGLMLDKSAALALASKIVDSITRHEKDPEVVDAISNDIISLLSEIGKATIPGNSLGDV